MTKKTTNPEAQAVTFDFEDETPVLVVSLDQFSVEIITKLALHGLSQKCGDSYASAAKAIEGTDMTASQYARGQVEAVVKQLVEGDWTTRTPGAGGAVTDLARAISEVLGEPIEDSVTRLADSSDEEKKALRAHPAVKAVLDRLRAERAAAKAQESAKGADTGPSLQELLG